MLEPLRVFREFICSDILKTRWRKRFLAIGGVVLLSVLTTITITFARLNTRTNTVQNELKFGQTKVTVNEKKDGWNLKEVTLTAESGPDYVPGVVRAMIIPYILGPDENYIYSSLDMLPKEMVDNKMALGDITLEFAEDWSKNWFYKDGYFYYKEVLDPNDPDRQTTKLLLKKVSLTNDTGEMIEKYTGTDIRVEVMASILQAEGGAAEQEWGVTVDGTRVLPDSF